jgi:D-3-phosphoglycerate dehydrogenase
MRAARSRNIPVVFTPTAQVRSIAEYCVAMILASARRLLWYDRKVREGQYDALRVYFGREIRNLTVGVLGGGEVARDVARILHAGFDARLIQHAPQDVEGLGPPSTAVDFDGLLRQSDVLTIHLPQNHHFTGILGAAQLALMKPTACLVNTSRGNALDLRAVAEALKTHALGGAALDVFDSEPLPLAHPLRNAPHCILSPHVAAHTHDVIDGYFSVTDDLKRVLDGQQPRFPANP